MRFILTIVFFFYCSFGFCQDSSLTVHKLSKMFKESIDQESKKEIAIGNGAWIICNQDSAYFKADTIKLYNNINYFYQLSSCCDFIDWTFYKKDAFLQSKLQICKEPSTHSAAFEDCKISYFTDRRILYLSVIKPKSSVEVFMVLKLGEIKLANGANCKVITLKRLFTNQPIVGPVY